MDALLEVTHVSKRFPGVQALDCVDFELAEGEVHALLGENGAGKSTLVKIITGAHQKDSGTIRLRGNEVNFHTPAEAQEAGIGGVYQEFSLVNTLSVAENIFLGEYPRRWLAIDWRVMNAAAAELLGRFGVDVRPTDILTTLGVATRQMIEIIKVVHRRNLKILILDEPTSSLSDNETKTLFEFITMLKKQGVAIIYISHRLDEIKRICDRITVFRNGRKVLTEAAEDMTVDAIVTAMIGSELKERYPKKCTDFGDKIFEVEGFSGKVFEDISFSVRKGEVLGITGLVGAGKTELLQALYGADKHDRGTVRIGGVTVRQHTPGKAIASGMGLLPESRKEQGLVLSMNGTHNISLASLDLISRPFLDIEGEANVANENFARLDIRPNDPSRRAVNLSGGNQQKVVLSKWLMRDCDVLLFDEPTRGIDVGAKFQIYSLIVDLAKAGKTVIVSSSEVEEISGICNRVLVMRRGRIIAELSGVEVDRANVLAAVTG